MNITLQYFDSCPGWKTADARLKAIIEERGLDVSIQYQRIETFEEAENFHFSGSPTVLLDGRDPFADGPLPVGLAFRT